MGTDTTETHYTASRFPLTIRVTITGDQLHWLYRYGVNTWREQLPLEILVPYPTRCIHGNGRPRRLGVGGLLSLLGIVLLIVTRDPWWLVAAGSALLLIGLALAVTAWRRPTLEWAVFDSIFPQKTVYFFCGPDREAFEQFAAELQNRILAARSPCD